MKKLKKQDLKKLALLGLASGTAFATQSVASEQKFNTIDPNQTLASNGCGGRHGCGHSDSVTPNTQPQSNYYNPSANNQFSANQPVQSSCHGMTQPTQPSSGCHASAQPTAYNQRNSYYYQQPQNSCSGMTQPTQPSSGCNASAQPTAYNQRGSYYYQQPQNSCGGTAQPTQPSSGCNASAQPTAYNQRGSYYYQQPQNSCSGMTQAYQPSSGCNASRPTAYNQKSSYNYQQEPQNGFNETTQPVEPSEEEIPTTPVEPQVNGVGSFQSYYQRSSGCAAMSRYTADNEKGSSAVVSTTSAQLDESHLMPMLDSQTKATYQGLDSAGKALALKLANQSCKGQNECKGLNACKTSEHACAGKGSCAGTAKGPFEDKNLAVKVAAMKMAEKRAKATSSR